MARYRQVTSLRCDPPDGTRFDGVQKTISLPSGASYTIADISGSGRIVRLWITLPLMGQRRALDDVELRIWWDGATEPSISVSLARFFGASFGRTRRLVSHAFTVEGGAYVCHLQMPFNRGAHIELKNIGSQVLSHLFFQLSWVEEEHNGDLHTLHAVSTARSVRAGEPSLTLVAIEGPGRFVGLTLDVQNQSWWLRPPLSHIPLPRGFGLGLLEGWETFTIDGEAQPGTGAEDYFNAGFYFQGAPFCTPTHGCTRRSFSTGRVSAYRFHTDVDAIPFQKSLTLTLDHGLRNSMAGHYSATMFWFQATSPIASGQAEHRPWPWHNPVQWLVIVAVMVCLALLLYQMA